MSLELYFDHNFPAPILIALRRRGVDILTSADDGTSRWPDDRLLERVTQLGRLLVTMDGDFLKLAADFQVAGRPFSGVVYVIQGDLSVGQVIDELELIAQASTIDEYWNRTEWLPL